MKHIMAATAALLMLTALVSCGGGERTTPPHTEKNSVYYWKTVLQLDDDELALLARHDIGRVYVRMFDVVEDREGYIADNLAAPNASLRVDHDQYCLLRDSLRHLEFVPVVYITVEGLRAMKDHIGVLARNITTRVRNMCDYDTLPNVGELQLDCDWTPSTEASFFALCDSIRHSIGQLGLDWRLSSTIRLHQLARKAPPVDRGVLMVYNTGNFNDPDARNSIIDADDVAPYLRRLPGYRLHLDVAYPTYSWQLLFSKRRFAGLLNGLELTDTTRFARRDDGLYEVLRDMPYHGRLLRAGDVVRRETSAYSDVARVKAMIERCLEGRPHSNILYHLDTDNLSKYTSDEIDNLLSTAL